MFQRILVPVDGSPTSDRSLDQAIALARLSGGSLRVIHALDEFSFARSLQSHEGHPSPDTVRADGLRIVSSAEARARAAGVPVDARLLDDYAGRVHERIADAARAWNADLIVMGTHGRRGVTRLMLGSSAENVVRVAPVPVLLVREPDAHETIG